MGYNKQHIPLLESEEGYNKLAKTYKTFHQRLHNRDHGLYQRFLPRNMEGMRVLDIGGADGRMAADFVDHRLSSYHIIDVADELLANAPAWTTTQQVDLREDWDLSEDYDIQLCFFVLLHIKDLDHFFGQARQYIKPGGRLILLHHLERKPFLHTVGHEKFRIKIEHHSYEDLERVAGQNAFSTDYLDLEPHGGGASRIFCFSMSA